VKAVNIFCGFGNLGIFWQLTRRRHRVMNLMIETKAIEEDQIGKM
jgi:hypothetical protein